MRVLIFANTPAHVHLYKHVVSGLQSAGHEVLVLARDYGCTLDLADAYDLPYKCYGKCDTTKYSLLANLPKQYLNIVRESRRFGPDLIFGMGAYAAHAGAITRTPAYLVLDSEPTTLDHRISRPFARAILTPDSFRSDLGDDHYVFAGFKECAYLHPDVFEPDDGIRSALGVDDDPFVIIRFNAFGSHHDVSQGGFSTGEREQLIRHLATDATVFVSDEGGDLDLATLPARPFDLHPSRLHDALAEASLLVADTQTMVTEAALLGTPAVRSNSFVGENDMGNFLELEDRGLIYNLVSFESVRDRASAILSEDGSEARWERKRRQLLDEKVNLTALLLSIVEQAGELDGVAGLRPYGDRNTDGTTFATPERTQL